MYLTRKLMFAVAFPLVLAACGEDVVEPGDELTKEEAEALIRGTMAALWDESAVIHVSEDSIVVRCRRGGRIKGVGNLPDEEFSGDTVRLVVDYRFAPSECEVTESGMELTVDGDPSFRYEFSIESIGSTRENNITGGFSGGVKWKLEDRSGNCAMDLTLMAPKVVGDMVEGSFEGRLCGHEVEVDAEGLLPPL